MAVEIPVVVDIDKAFDEAAKRVDTAIKPLQQAIDKNAANIKLKFGEEYDINLDRMVSKYETLEKLVNSVQTDQSTGAKRMKYSVGEWASALQYAKEQLSDLNALQAAGGKVSPTQLSALRESISVLTVSIEQRRHEVDLIERATQKQIAATRAIEAGNYALIQEASTISQISDKISSLRGKLENLNPSKDKTEWSATAKEIEKATAQLRKYEQTLSATTKPGSIDRMRTEMQKLEQQWNSMSKRQKFDASGNLTSSATKVIKKYQDLTIEAEKYGQGLAQMSGRVKSSIDGTTNALRTQSSVLRNLASYASMYVSVFGLLRFAKQIRDITGELEYQRVALGHLIQDEEYGAKLFNQIKQSALESPFQIKDLVTYTKQLAAYRIEQENLFDTTKRLADISAGLGVDMNRLILAYGQVRAASVLRGQELRQFTEAGIPLVELLADKMGELHDTTYRTADVFKLISERAVPFSAISEIFEDLTEKGGMFYKMQEEQAKTLKGRWEKLKDAYSLGLQEAGETQTFLWQNNLVLNALTLLAKNIRWIPKILESLGWAWAAYTIATIKSTRATNAARIAQVRLTIDEIKEITAKNLSAKATAALTKARIREKAATNAVSRTWWKLNAAMIANPIGAIIAGVTALVSLFVFWRKKTDEQTESFKDLTEAIEDVSRSEKQYEHLKKQINAYERLASKTQRTAKENVELAKTLDVLRTAFPGVALTIDKTNDSLEATISDLKKLNEAEKLSGIQKAFRERTIAQSDANKLSEEIARISQEQNKAWEKYSYFRENTGEESRQAKKAKQEYEKLGEQLEENNKKYIQTLKYIQALDKYLQNGDFNNGLAVWQKTMMRMKDFMVDGKTFNLIGEGDIEGYDSLYKGLRAIDKIYQDATNSAKEMKAALSSVSDQYKEDAEMEIRVEEGRRNAAKAILDTFGYISKIDQKKDTSSLAILKEELKNVQDIYKKYKEFLKYMSEAQAQKKIKEIYSGVTAIDFLSPELYKKRLSDLLGELRKLQGRVRVGAKKLSAEMADDLKTMLRGDEGFRSQAYKLKGENAYTIGYGFYNQLTDGRKVVEGMTMTIEEAEAELNRQIERTASITSKLIEQYGNGIQLTERQFNVLANLAYQGPATLKRVLKEANGDAAKLAEALKDAAWPYVAKPQQANVKNRDMRRALLFQLAGPVSDDEAKELASTITNLEKIVQDVDWEEFVDAITERLDKLKDDIKRSEAARNFFKDMFDLTGDQDIAKNLTFSVYGDIGSDLEKKLQEQLSGAFVLDDKKIKAAGLSLAQANADVAEGIIKGDYLLLRDYLRFVTDANKDNAEQLLEARISANADWLRDFQKTYQKARTYQERIDALNQQRIAKKREAESKNVGQSGMAAIDTYYDRKIAEVEVEALKNTDEWIAAFENLDKVGTTTLKNLIALIEQVIQKSGSDLTPESLRTLVKNLEDAQDALYKRNVFSEGLSGIKSYIDAIKGAARARRALRQEEDEETREKLKLAEKQKRKALEQLKTSVEGLADQFNNLNQIVSSVSDLLELDELSDGQAILNGLSKGIAAVGAALTFVSAIITAMAANPVVLGITAAVAAIASLSSVLSNIKTNRANREIKRQDELIKDLEASYSRLDKALSEAFGNEYVRNYNQMLILLEAKARAYQAQADAERRKGKKADEATAKDYERSAQQMEDEIAQLRKDASSFFAGSDLAAAAESFADAWLSAYQEFGDTAGAIEERMEEMVRNIVKKAALSGIAQSVLGDWYSSLADIQDWNAKVVAEKWQEAMALVGPMVDGMQNFANEMSTQGRSLRKTSGQFTGISRDLASASEESITGLAAGINTQNFYMQHIDLNVSAILATLTGGTTTAGASNTGEYVDPYKDQMLLYVGALPQMRDEMAAIRSLLDKVIKPVGTPSSHRVIIG